MKNFLILGIDLAGSEKKPTGICLMDNNLKIRCFLLFSNKQIINLAKRIKPKIIAIDAPLSLPLARKSLEKKSNIHFRKCDLQLLKLKIKFFPITLGPMRKLTKRGIKLKKILEGLKFKVIEVYPGATQDILKIPRKNKGKEKLLNGLKKLGIKNLNKNLTHDELDAVSCAFTAYLFLKNKYSTIGDKKEGLIFLPKIKTICGPDGI